METHCFTSTDLGEVEHYVNDVYSTMRIGATGSPTRAAFTRQVLSPELEFHEVDYSFELAYAAEPADKILVCDVVANTIHRRGDLHGPADSFGPGDQFIVIRPGLPYAGVARGTRMRFTMLDPRVLAEVAAADADSAPVELTGHRPVSRQARTQFQRCVSHVRQQFTQHDAGPLLVSTASQYLAAALLHTYPNTAVCLAGARDSHDASQTTLARAMAYIEGNPDQPITLADIARASSVTPRAVQLAFRRHRDTTPMAHLRRVRLGLARDQLLAAHGDDSVTVTAVAAQWGFSLSRFSQQYRAAYGELPSQTLRS